MAYPLYGKLAMREFFGNGAVGVLGELGYEFQELTSVPLQPVSGTEGSANVNVGGLIISLGLALQF